MGSIEVNGIEFGHNPLNLAQMMRPIRHECMTYTEDGISSSVGGGGLNSTSSTGLGGTDMVNHPGIISTSVTTLTTDYAILGGSSGAVLFGGAVWKAEALIAINTLSDGTDTYTYRFGFLDSTTAADAVDGVYIEYNSASSANWIMGTSSNSTRTKTASSTAVVAGVWTRLGVIVNATGTSVEYFVNGVSIGTVTTNIPTGTGRQTGTKLQLVKVAGVTLRAVFHDFMEWNGIFTTARY